ncbi:MAG: hypothetical protein JWQ96_2386 [Segetibacter sp.]|nr:hypothetical protein [Segetibacter sp.]
MLGVPLIYSNQLCVDTELILYFKRIGKTITVVLIWLAITCIAAIKGDNAFINQHVSLANLLFYTWIVISGVILVILIRKIWRGQKLIEQSGQD